MNGDNGQGQADTSERIQDVVKTAVHRRNDQAQNKWRQQRGQTRLMTPRHEPDNHGSRYMSAWKRTAAGSSTRRDLMHEIEEEVSRERRPETLEAVVGAVDREQDEE